MKSTDPQNSGFESGFNREQQISRDNEHPTRLRQGILPSCQKIPQLHSLWLKQYQSLLDRNRPHRPRVAWTDPMPSNIAESDNIDDIIEACRNSIRALEEEMQQWLNDTNIEWRRIREEFREELGDRSSNSEVRILIRANETLIWQLPWQFCDLLSQSSNSRTIRITFGHL
jgi:hypothetical protein